MLSKPSQKPVRYSDKTDKKLLGELELAIMGVIWKRSSATVRVVLEALSKKRSLAYTTVMTVMGRLTEKGLLRVEKSGKAHTYRAAKTQAEFESEAAGQAAHSLLAKFGGEVAVSQFVKQLSETDPDQLTRLAELTQLAKKKQ